MKDNKSKRRTGRTTKIVNDYVEELLLKGEIKDIKDHDIVGELDVYSNDRYTTADQDYANRQVFYRIKQRMKEHFVWRNYRNTTNPYWYAEKIVLSCSRKYMSIKITNEASDELPK